MESNSDVTLTMHPASWLACASGVPNVPVGVRRLGEEVGGFGRERVLGPVAGAVQPPDLPV